VGTISKWLLHDDQKELFDYLFAIVLNAVFLALIALVLWPLGKAAMAWRLAKGYWIFWTAIIVTASVLVLVHRFFRMDLYSRFDAYVITGLITSGFVQAGWSAFAAPLVRHFAADSAVWVSIIVYSVGVLSCYVASVIVAAFYIGSIYRHVNAILAIVSFIVFSVLPAVGNTIYGWFFNLFQRNP
jgi:hypothetical protein